jgi:hypothetical protein
VNTAPCFAHLILSSMLILYWSYCYPSDSTSKCLMALAISGVQPVLLHNPLHDSEKCGQAGWFQRLHQGLIFMFILRNVRGLPHHPRYSMLILTQTTCVKNNKKETMT